MASDLTRPLLLQGGTVLIHEENDHVQVKKTDILVVDGLISEIANDIQAPSDTQTIDCTDKIISPGFVDTHHHVWQTLLKARHGDQTLLQYLPDGNFTSSLHEPEDVFWAQLAGCLEMIDCGTTTVVDFAHINYKPENNYRAIDATAASGIRSVYCYCPTPLTKSWTPFEVEQNALGGHVLPTFDTLASQAPWADGRITLGFAFDTFHYLPKEYLTGLMQTLAKHKIDLITTHYVRGEVQAPRSIPEQLEERGILDQRWLIAHSSNLTQDDADLYKKHDVHVSSTPSTELQMAMGVPIAAYRDDLGNDLGHRCSIGVDCHSATSAFIPYEARLGLQSARAVYGEKFLENGRQTASVHYKVEEAFNLATIRGARSAKMSNKIGSITKGKAADFVIFGTTSPSMLAAAQHDPIAAIVLHSSPADVDTVIVDGVVRKENGVLPRLLIKDGDGKEKSIVWKDVAQEILARQKVMTKKIEALDLDAALERLIDTWHIDRAAALATKPN